MTRSQIIAEDWKDCYKTLSGIALGTIVLVLATAWYKPPIPDPRVVVAVLSLCDAVAIATACSRIPRDPAEWTKLLGPTTKDELIVTKFLSAFSMVLFVVNIPGLMLLDLRFLFNLNAGALLLTTVLMAHGVVQLDFHPMLIVLALGCAPLVTRDDVWHSVMSYGKVCIHWVAAHPTISSVGALCAIPIIVAWSVACRETMIDYRAFYK